ncbi:MAG: ATP-binding protein [Hyphomicrobiaceae bacterium]
MANAFMSIQPDIIDRLTKARPLAALAELIWNSLDADADLVTVTLTRDPLKTLTAITIADDGDGLPRVDALAQFKRYGGSWKQPGGLTRRKKRALHGFEGRGRFNALALGALLNGISSTNSILAASAASTPSICSPPTTAPLSSAPRPRPRKLRGCVSLSLNRIANTPLSTPATRYRRCWKSSPSISSTTATSASRSRESWSIPPMPSATASPNP